MPATDPRPGNADREARGRRRFSIQTEQPARL